MSRATVRGKIRLARTSRARYPSFMTIYTAVVQRDPETKMYVGYVPGFPGAHSQAESLDELQSNLREVIALLLEDGEPKLEAEFIGVQTVAVA